MKRHMLVAWVYAVMVLATCPTHAQNWSRLATISSTLGVSASRICVGESTRGDVGCPTYAPSLTTAGDVSVTGNLSANKFIGDGSGLTGLSTSSDRIASGTSSIIVSQSGHISFTTAGTERMVIESAGNTGIGTLFPSTTLHIASNLAALPTTNVYQQLEIAGGSTLPNARLSLGTLTSAVGSAQPGTGVIQALTNAGSFKNLVLNPRGANVGVGTSTPYTTLQVSGGLIVSQTGQTTTPTLYISGTTGFVGIGTTNPTVALTVNGTAGFLTQFYSPVWNDLNSYLNSQILMGGTSKYIAFKTSATEQLRIDSAGNVGIGTTSPGQTLDVSGTARIVSRTMIGGAATPSATLQVSGSLLLAGSDSTTCDNTHLGILRRNPTTGRLQVCK